MVREVSDNTLTLRCLRCGAHTVVLALHHPGGQCGNCSSYRLAPLDDPCEPTPPHLSNDLDRTVAHFS
jgi:ribosomal protein S27AE